MEKFKTRRPVEQEFHIEASGTGPSKLHLTAKRTEITSQTIDKPTSYFVLMSQGPINMEK